MDLYDDTENLISSDEGSGGEEERLLNVSVQVDNAAISGYNGKSKSSRATTLPRRKQTTSIFKKRAVKWMNNKKRRDVYKRSIQQQIRALRARIPKRVVNKENVYKAEQPAAETICFELSSDEDSYKEDDSYQDEDDMPDLDEDAIQNVEEDEIMNLDEEDEVQDDDESETQDGDKDESLDDDKDETESINEDVNANLRAEIEKSVSSDDALSTSSAASKRKKTKMDMEGVNNFHSKAAESLSSLQRLVERAEAGVAKKKDKCESFCEFLCLELKDIKLESTFEQVTEDLMKMVRQAKAREKEHLQTLMWRPESASSSSLPSSLERDFLSPTTRSISVESLPRGSPFTTASPVSVPFRPIRKESRSISPLPTSAPIRVPVPSRPIGEDAHRTSTPVHILSVEELPTLSWPTTATADILQEDESEIN